MSTSCSSTALFPCKQSGTGKADPRPFAPPKDQRGIAILNIGSKGTKAKCFRMFYLEISIYMYHVLSNFHVKYSCTVSHVNVHYKHFQQIFSIHVQVVSFSHFYYQS